MRLRRAFMVGPLSSVLVAGVTQEEGMLVGVGVLVGVSRGTSAPALPSPPDVLGPMGGAPAWPKLLLSKAKSCTLQILSPLRSPVACSPMSSWVTPAASDTVPEVAR